MLWKLWLLILMLCSNMLCHLDLGSPLNFSSTNPFLQILEFFLFLSGSVSLIVVGLFPVKMNTIPCIIRIWNWYLLYPIVVSICCLDYVVKNEVEILTIVMTMAARGDSQETQNCDQLHFLVFLFSYFIFLQKPSPSCIVFLYMPLINQISYSAENRRPEMDKSENV